MIDTILDRADPFIAEAILGLLFGYFGFATRTIFQTRESQAHLRKAIETSVDLVTDHLAAIASAKMGRLDQKVTIPQPVLDDMVNYVTSSVPDSIRYLKANRRHLVKMVEAAAKSRILGLTQLIR